MIKNEEKGGQPLTFFGNYLLFTSFRPNDHEPKWESEFFECLRPKLTIFEVKPSIHRLAYGTIARTHSTVKRCLMTLWLKKRLVSSANIIRSTKRDEFGRSLTYTRNRSGPKIDPWETPQVTYLRSIKIYYHYDWYFTCTDGL